MFQKNYNWEIRKNGLSLLLLAVWSLLVPLKPLRLHQKLILKEIRHHKQVLLKPNLKFKMPTPTKSPCINMHHKWVKRKTSNKLSQTKQPKPCRQSEIKSTLPSPFLCSLWEFCSFESCTSIFENISASRAEMPYLATWQKQRATRSLFLLNLVQIVSFNLHGVQITLKQLTCKVDPFFFFTRMH